jgi:putative ATPase
MEKEPLASKLRPDNLDGFFGQDHLVGEEKPLKNAIQNKLLFSMIFWGPPGVGKTTLAKIYANSFDADFHELSAVSSGKGDIREIVEKADESKVPTIIFLDEIHRFNKAQQDYLLPFVEKGIITLIGATTENPSFEIISPLLSRCRIFVMNPLSEDEIKEIIEIVLKALSDESGEKIYLNEKTKDWIIGFSNGDARQTITIMENCYKLYKNITVETLKETVQSKFLRYDKNAEEHYNLISAFIKSMRASDENAAIYYLSRMIESGEDPLFIARRMVIFASEDIGNIQPTALVIANEIFNACQKVGYPECSIILSQGVIYLSRSNKDRAAYDALRAAQEDVKNFGNLEIPLKVRNPETKLMKDVGYGKDYKMYDKESFLPEKLKDKVYVKKPKVEKETEPKKINKYQSKYKKER